MQRRTVENRSFFPLAILVLQIEHQGKLPFLPLGKKPTKTPKPKMKPIPCPTTSVTAFCDWKQVRRPVTEKSSHSWITWLQLSLWKISTKLPFTSPCYQCSILNISPMLSPILLSGSAIIGVSHLSQVLEIPMPDYFSWKRRNLIFSQVWRQEKGRLLLLSLDCRKTATWL